jgi:hypothetical protein
MVSTIEDKLHRILRAFRHFGKLYTFHLQDYWFLKDFGSSYIAPNWIASHFSIHTIEVELLKKENCLMRVSRENFQTRTINCADGNCNVCRNGVLFSSRS